MAAEILNFGQKLSICMYLRFVQKLLKSGTRFVATGITGKVKPFQISTKSQGIWRKFKKVTNFVTLDWNYFNYGTVILNANGYLFIYVEIFLFNYP